LTGDNSTTGGKTTTAAGISATPSTSPSAGGNDAAASPAPARTVGLGDDGKINWCEGVKESDFTGSAVETFGAKAVKDAYCLMLTFTLDESTWIGSLLTEPEGGYKPEM